MFDFRGEMVFVWDTAFQSTKWLNMLKIWGRHVLPGPPGYAYASKQEYSVHSGLKSFLKGTAWL